MVMMWIHVLLLLPCLLFSAEFTAKVNRNEAAIGEGISLELTLKDASTNSQPSLDFLKQAFHVTFRQQSKSTRMVNGKTSSSLTWSYSLIPQLAGDVQIPAIPLDTSEGKLLSNPITIHVAKERKDTSTSSEAPIRLETETSHLDPYKNEPFLFTIRLISKTTVANLLAEKFDVEGAIVEHAGEPTIVEKVENGIKTATIEFKYLITPLRSGSLTIPSTRIHGGIPQKRNQRSLFDDSYEPFSMLHGMMSLQPFAMATNDLVVEIRPPAENMVPWLPATALEIQESWDDTQTFRHGDVFTRTFIINAEGIHSSQLPSLEKKMDGSSQFKSYADKAELKDEIVNGTLKSSRIEKYTLIPQESGQLTLPEISIEWWNTKQEKRQTSVLPARTIQVQPEKGPAFSQPVNISAAESEDTQISSEPLVVPTYIYALIGGLAFLLVIAIVLLLQMQRKMRRMLEVPARNIPSTKPKPKPPQNLTTKASNLSSKREKLDDLNPT